MTRLGARAITACVVLLVSGCGGGGSGASRATETILYSFGASSTDGIGPMALIQGTDGNFYGTTFSGGAIQGDASGDGAVYRITPAGEETILYSFGASSTDGFRPSAVLIQGTDGNFYGTALSGGANGNGAVYRITLAGEETVLYSFSSPFGGVFPATLIQGADGNFYGVASGGGVNYAGSVFKITPAGVETVLYSFQASTTDGSSPNGLIQGADGNFYGTTRCGGDSGYDGFTSCAGYGTVYRIAPAGEETTLYSFGASSTDAIIPGALIQGADGELYGATQYGGANHIGGALANASLGNGTVFKITL